jgi:hypothetical protein
MASKVTENVVGGDILIIKHLCKQLRYSPEKTKFYIDAAKHGVIAVETFLEYAISKVGKLKRCNKDGQDFTDGSDAKKGIVHTHSHGKSIMNDTRECVIGNVKNKNGKLRILIADVLVGELYYFKVPKKAFAGKKTLHFVFNVDGGAPVKFVNRQSGKTLNWKLWNEYRVNTFKELCQ